MSIDGLNRLFERFPVLETESLVLREVSEDDDAALFAIFSDPEVTEFYDLDSMESIREAREMIARWRNRYAERQSIRWGIELKSASGLVGTCGLHPRSEWRAALGYDLNSAYWGRGIMSGALRRVHRYAFEQLGLHRIEALVIPGNTASERLLETLGFELEGVLREYAYFKSAYQDLQMYSLLKSDYDHRNERG